MLPALFNAVLASVTKTVVKMKALFNFTLFFRTNVTIFNPSYLG